MKFKTTIILAVVAIIGAAYVFLYEKKQSSKYEKYKFEKKVLHNVSVDSIYKIKMIKAGKPFVFEKVRKDYAGGAERWIVKEPIETRADEAVVKGFLSSLEFLENVTRFEEVDDKKVDKKDYGLDKPTFELTLSIKQTGMGDEGSDSASSTKDVTFYIGDRVSTGKHIYVQLKGSDEVFVVDDEIALKLDYTLSGFRDKWLIEIDKAAVTKIDIQKASGEQFITFRSGEFWRMSKPVTDRCNNKNIAEIIESLKNLRIEEADFINDSGVNLSEYGLDNPRLTLKLTQNGAEQGVQFGHAIDNKVYAKREGEPSVFLLKSIIVDELSVNPDLLRSRELVRFETVAGSFGVNRIEIKSQKNKLTIKKTKEYDWFITEPIENLADMDIVKELVEEAKDLRILKFVTSKSDDLSKYGLDNPIFDFSIYKDGVKNPVRMFCGNRTQEGNQCYVKRPNEDPIFTMTTLGLYEKLEGGLLTFYDKLVMEFDKDRVKTVDLEKNGINFSIEKITSSKGNWQLNAPVSGRPDENVIDQIVHDTSFLKAEKYVAQRSTNLKEYGLDKPRMKLSFTCEKQVIPAHAHDEVEDPNLPKTDAAPTTLSYSIYIGDKSGSGSDANYYAMSKDNNFIFEISNKIVKLSESELVSKSIQKFDSGKAKKLVLTFPDKQVVFARPEGTWKAIEPEIADLTSRQIEFVVWILSNITANSIKEYNMNNVINYRLNSPDVKAVVHLDDNSIHEILASKAENSNSEYYVMSRNSSCIYTVDVEIIEKLIEFIP